MMIYEFLSKPQRIGFTESFPVKEVLESYYVDLHCRRFPVTVRVDICNLSFGKNNEFKVKGIVTSRIDISDKLFLGGFGSMCCFDEAKTMKEAVAYIAAHKNLVICEDICPWPFCKVIVTKH